MLVCPAVQDRCQRSGLRAADGQVLLEHEYQDHVAFGCEVGDGPGDHGPAIGPSSRRDLGVVAALESGFGYVDRIVTVFLPEQHGSSGREHLIG